MPRPQSSALFPNVKTKTNLLEEPSLEDTPANTKYNSDNHFNMSKPTKAPSFSRLGDKQLSRAEKFMVITMAVLFVVLITFLIVQIWHITSTDNTISELQGSVDKLADSTNDRFTDLLVSQGAGVDNYSVIQMKDGCATVQRDLIELQDCKEYRDHGANISGLYRIFPPNGRPEGYCVYCDMDTDDGGWIVIQRRVDGSVYFFRDWLSYANGFGDPTHEFWIGLDILHILTSTPFENVTLRVDLWTYGNEYANASYSKVTVGASNIMYQLQYEEFLGGTAGDSLQYFKNYGFSTYDHDYHNSKCATRYRGGWWYATGCYYANLNGMYNFDNNAPADGLGLIWYKWLNRRRESMKRTEMKLRSD